MSGTLFVVATPIGNLEDLTFRALRVLGEVDLVAAEDTRRTSKLFAHYGIETPLSSYREHNEARQAPRLVERLAAGESIALVSDAGTPGISDPGSRLVRATLAAGLKVVPVPGPSAVTAALSASGFEADQFVFMGFPPAAGSARRRWFDQLEQEARTVVLFESPHRISRTLSDLATVSVKRPIIIQREISKIHESLVVCHSSIQDVTVPGKGELVIVVGPESKMKPKHADHSQIVSVFTALVQAPDISRDAALKLTAAAVECDANRVRNVVRKHAILVKQQNRATP